MGMQSVFWDYRVLAFISYRIHIQPVIIFIRDAFLYADCLPGSIRFSRHTSAVIVTLTTTRRPLVKIIRGLFCTIM